MDQLVSKTRRPMLLSRRWVQVSLLVFILGFFGLGLAGYLNYKGEPPIPARVVDSSGQTVFTRDDVIDGQKVFLANGLMEYGSIFGHGAYLGPDYTADYLHRQIGVMRRDAVATPTDGRRCRGAATITAAITSDLRTNRYDAESDTLAFTDAQVGAFDQLTRYYSAFFSEPTTRFGLRRSAITDPTELRQLTAFFAWTAWAAAAERPGSRTRTRTTGRARPRSATRRPPTRSCGARSR